MKTLKIMKKASVLLGLVLVLCLGFVLAGCGGKETEEVEEPTITEVVMTYDEVADFLSGADYSVEHWNNILYGQKYVSYMEASGLLAKSTENGINGIATGIIYETIDEQEVMHEIKVYCVDGTCYMYSNGVATAIEFVGGENDFVASSANDFEEETDDTYDDNEISTTVILITYESAIIETQSLVQLLQEGGLSQFFNQIDGGKEDEHEFVFAKKVQYENYYEIRIDFDVEPSNNVFYAETFTIVFRFDNENQFEGFGIYAYIGEDLVGEASLYNTNQEFTEPDWFDINDFADLI